MKKFILLNLFLIIAQALQAITVKNMSSEPVTIHDFEWFDNREIYMIMTLESHGTWQHSGIKGLHITFHNNQTNQPCTSEFTDLTDRKLIIITQDQEIGFFYDIPE